MAEESHWAIDLLGSLLVCVGDAWSGFLEIARAALELSRRTNF